MPAAWQQILEPGALLLAGNQEIVVGSEQEDSLLDFRKQGLHHLIALLQELQLPLQHCRWKNLGQVAQLGYQLLQTFCILSSLHTSKQGMLMCSPCGSCPIVSVGWSCSGSHFIDKMGLWGFCVSEHGTERCMCRQ